MIRMKNTSLSIFEIFLEILTNEIKLFQIERKLLKTRLAANSS